jgi:hypothetical protein
LKLNGLHGVIFQKLTLTPRLREFIYTIFNFRFVIVGLNTIINFTLIIIVFNTTNGSAGISPSLSSVSLHVTFTGKVGLLKKSVRVHCFLLASVNLRGFVHFIFYNFSTVA